MWSQMIPKLIHQTAKTNEVPRNCIAYQEKLRELHPDWTYRLWTDADNLEFVSKEYPEFRDIFVKLPRNIMRADVIRYLLLYRLGGLYLDLDYEMLKPFDLLNHGAVLPWETDSQRVPGDGRIANSLMAAEPGHPFFKMVIDDLKSNPPLSATVDVLDATGPDFLTRILGQAMQAGITVHSPPRRFFNPPTPRSPRQYRAIVKQGDAYGIHHVYGSWREFTLTQKIRNRVVSAIKWFT
jgi:mannosyltransferase OCH1-like enzyme